MDVSMKESSVVFVAFVLFFGLALGQFPIGHTNWRQPCVMNHECKAPMKCVPLVSGANCRVRPSGGSDACQCLMPSRKSHNCNDHDDCAAGLRCTGGQCGDIKIGTSKWKQSCWKNRECRTPMSCIPVRRGGFDCGVLYPCKCLMPSRAGQNCNDQPDCSGNNLRCVRGRCKKISVGECDVKNLGRDCKKGLTCARSKCVRHRHIGEVCDVSANCLDFFTCAGGKCVDQHGWYTWFIRDHAWKTGW